MHFATFISFHIIFILYLMLKNLSKKNVIIFPLNNIIKTRNVKNILLYRKKRTRTEYLSRQKEDTNSLTLFHIFVHIFFYIYIYIHMYVNKLNSNKQFCVANMMKRKENILNFSSNFLTILSNNKS